MSVQSQADILNGFTFKLFEKLSAGKNENFFVSPFSIVTALSMALTGAKSETLNQLKCLLNLNNLSNERIHQLQHEYLNNLSKLTSTQDSVVLNTANKIYSKSGYELRPEYVNDLSKYYSSEIEAVDFGKSEESANKINKWVADKTNNKITNLISSSVLNDLTRLVLLNAIYFKGKWLNQFNKEHTYKDDFKLRDGSVQQVDMMKLLNKKFLFKINPGGLTACTCELPYVGESISMTIILPHEGINIEDVEKQLNHETLNAVFEKDTRPGKVHLYLPKFKLDLKSELSDTLKSLGAPLPFDQSNADFSGIANDPNGLYISKVIHQAVVEVNEEGTEAAAATAAVLMTRMAVMDFPEEFKCNRPFIFVIHEKTNNGVLFFGKYMKPQ